jgi:hypothetical protein
MGRRRRGAIRRARSLFLREGRAPRRQIGAAKGEIVVPMIEVFVLKGGCEEKKIWLKVEILVNCCLLRRRMRMSLRYLPPLYTILLEQSSSIFIIFSIIMDLHYHCQHVLEIRCGQVREAHEAVLIRLESDH